jgi:hypothetical protein|tara:strand:- start:435 stop:575 length:141 start_codon:yes stop_codon:yes gene_type:complete
MVNPASSVDLVEAPCERNEKKEIRRRPTLAALQQQVQQQQQHQHQK